MYYITGRGVCAINGRRSCLVSNTIFSPDGSTFFSSSSPFSSQTRSKNLVETLFFSFFLWYTLLRIPFGRCVYIYTVVSIRQVIFICFQRVRRTNLFLCLFLSTLNRLDRFGTDESFRCQDNRLKCYLNRFFFRLFPPRFNYCDTKGKMKQQNGNQTTQKMLLLLLLLLLTV